MGAGEPVLQVVRGAPTDEELAALVGVVLTRARAATPRAPAEPSTWVRSSRPGIRAGRLPTVRGPRAWRASALPG